MRKNFIKSLAFVLAVLMVMTALPMGVFAGNHVHSYNWEDPHDATAIAHGNIGYYKCSCGKFFATPGGSEISADSVIVHNYDKWSASGPDHRVSEATCQKKAVYYKKCTVCGAFSDNETFEIGSTIPHSDKDAVDWTVPAGADCTKAAFVLTKNCEMCGLVLDSKSVPKGNHETEPVGALAPNCEREGHEQGIQCKICKVWTWGGQSIAKTDHVPMQIPGQEAVEATCTTGGWTAGTRCQFCQKVLTEHKQTPALDHNIQAVTKRPVTCMEDGYKEDGELCLRCGLIAKPAKYFGQYNIIVIKAPGYHVYSHKAAVVATTSNAGCKEHWECTQSKDEDGKTITEYFVRPTKKAIINGKEQQVWITVDDEEASNYTLNDGQYVYQQVAKEAVIIEALAHDHMWKKNKDKSYAKTCLKDGLEVTYCTVCGKEVETVLKATGHEMDWVVVSEPTCIKTGTMVQQCKVCRETGQSSTIDMVDHTWKRTETGDCTKGGEVTYTCTVCGKTKKEPLPPRDSHSDEDHDGVCDICGTKYCTCICHNQKWYGKILYYFVKIWWQYFGIKEKCECGVVHYTKPNSNEVPNVT